MIKEMKITSQITSGQQESKLRRTDRHAHIRLEVYTVAILTDDDIKWNFSQLILGGHKISGFNSLCNFFSRRDVKTWEPQFPNSAINFTELTRS